MKKFVNVFLACFFAVFSTFASISAQENSKKGVYTLERSRYTNPDVEVYVNEKDNSKYAEFDLSDFKDESRLVIYDNPETEEYVYIDIATPTTKQGRSWSGGTIPTGRSTLTPHAQSGLVYAQFKVDCLGKPVTMLDAYGEYVSASLLDTSITSFKINNAEATNTRYARTTMNFKYSAWSGSVNGYLMLELDVKGHARISWEF